MPEETITLSAEQAAVLDAALPEGATRQQLVQSEADAKILDLQRDQCNARWTALSMAQKLTALDAGEAA